MFVLPRRCVVTIRPFEVHLSYLCSMLSLLKQPTGPAIEHLDQEDDSLKLNNLYSTVRRRKLGSSIFRTVIEPI